MRTKERGFIGSEAWTAVLGLGFGLAIIVVGLFVLYGVDKLIPPRQPVAGYDYPAQYQYDGAICYVYRQSLSCLPKDG